MTSTTEHPAVLATRVDRPDPKAVTANAWALLVRTLEELALITNPLEVEPIDVADRLPHLAVADAVERFSTYAEVTQQLIPLLDVRDDGPPADVARRDELSLVSRSLFEAMLDGHPYSPGWTAGTMSNAVRLGELASRYREEASDARRTAARVGRTADQRVRELARTIRDLTGRTRYWPVPEPHTVNRTNQVDVAPGAAVVHLPGATR